MKRLSPVPKADRVISHTAPQAFRADLVENFANFQPYGLAFAYFCAGSHEWALSSLTKLCQTALTSRYGMTIAAKN